MKINKNDKGWVNVDEPDNSTQKTKQQYEFEVNGKKVNPYDMEKTSRVPVWLKALFAKWWIPGAVFYFISFGLGGVLAGDTLAIILGLVCGMATDVLLNHFFRESSRPGHDYTKFVFCGRHTQKTVWRRFYTLPINLIYYVVLSELSAWFIDYIIRLMYNASIISSVDEFMFAVGALFYATMMLILDVAFSMLRNLVEYIKSKKGVQKVEEPDEDAEKFAFKTPDVIENVDDINDKEENDKNKGEID